MKQYRAEIDGLPTIAVLSVIFFQAEIFFPLTDSTVVHV